MLLKLTVVCFGAISSLFGGSRAGHQQFFSCSSLLGKYHHRSSSCQRHQQQHYHQQQQQQQNGGLFTSAKTCRSSLSPGQIDNFEEEEGAEEDNNNLTTTATTFYQPRTSENSTAAAPYYYGDIVTTTTTSFSNQSPAHIQRSPLRNQPLYNHPSQTTFNGGGLLALVMDGLRVQLKKPGIRSNGNSGGLGRKSLGTHLRSPNVHRSAEFTVSLRGWLYRLEGAAPLKQWKRRWCVLTDYVLFYYKDINEEKKLGSVLLPSYRISPCFPTADGISRRHAFKAEHSNMKTYYFAADCKQTAQQWMNALSLASIMQLAAMCPQMGLQQTTNSSKEFPKTSALNLKSKNLITAQTLPKTTSSANGDEQQSMPNNNFHLFSSSLNSQQQQPKNNGVNQRAIGLDESGAGFFAYEQQQMMYNYQNKFPAYQSASQAHHSRLTPSNSSAASLNLYNSIGLPMPPTDSTGGRTFIEEDASAILHAFAPPKPQRLLQNQQQQQYYEDAMLTYDRLPAMQQQQQMGSISSSSVLSYSGGGGYPAQMGAYYLPSNATAGFDGYYFGTAGAAAAAEELPPAYLQNRLPPRPHSADFLERDDQEKEGGGDQTEDFDEECQNAFTVAAAKTANPGILPMRPKSSMARYGPMLIGTGGGQLQPQRPTLQTAAPQIFSQTTSYSGLLYNNSTTQELPSPLRPPLPLEYNSSGLQNGTSKESTAVKSSSQIASYYATTTSEDESNCLMSSQTTEDGLIEMISKEEVYKASQLFFQRQSSSVQPPNSLNTDSNYTNTYSSSEASSDLNLNSRNQHSKITKLKTAVTVSAADWNDVGLPTVPPFPPPPSSAAALNTSSNESGGSSVELLNFNGGRVKAAKMAFESAAAAAANSSSCSSSLQSFQMINTPELNLPKQEEEAEIKFKLSSKVRTYRRPKSGGGNGSCTGTSDTSSDIVPVSAAPEAKSKSTLNSTTSTSTMKVSTTTTTSSTSSSAPYYYSDLLSAEQREQLRRKLDCNFAASPPPLLSRASGSGGGPARSLGMTTLQGVKNQHATSFSLSASKSSLSSKEEGKAASQASRTSVKKVNEVDKKSTEEEAKQQKEQEEADNECNEKLQQEMVKMEKLEILLKTDTDKDDAPNKETSAEELLVTSGDGGHIYENYHRRHTSVTPTSLDGQDEQKQTRSTEPMEETLDPNGLTRGGSGSSKHSSSTTASNGRQKRRVKRRSPKEQDHHHQNQNNASDSEIAKTDLSSRHYRKSCGGKPPKSSNSNSTSGVLSRRLCFSAANGLQKFGEESSSNQEELTLLLLALRRRQSELANSVDRLRLAMDGEATMAELEPHRAPEYQRRREELAERLAQVEAEYEGQLPTIEAIDGRLKQSELKSRNSSSKSSKSKSKSTFSSKTGSYPKKAASMSTLLDERGYFDGDDKVHHNGKIETDEDCEVPKEEASSVAATSTVRLQLSELQLAAASAAKLPSNEFSKTGENSSSTTPTPMSDHHLTHPPHLHQDTNLEHLRRQQTALAGELDRVRGLLTHSTRRLEEKAVENAQMEQEMRLARSKLKQVLASEQEAAELARSSKLAAELAHINAVIDDLHSRRQELNRAIEGLKLCPPMNIGDSKIPLRGAYFSQEEIEVENGENSNFSSPSIPLYENITASAVAATINVDQVNNNNNNNNNNNKSNGDQPLLLNHHHNHLNSLEDEDENDLENDEFFTLNINLTSKQYGGNKFTSSSLNKEGISSSNSSSLEINNNDSIQHNLNSTAISSGSSTMCEFDPTKDMIGHHNHHHLMSSHPYGSDGSIIDQQIRQIYNYQNQQNSTTTSTAKPAEIRTVREVKREAERRKVVQQQLNFQNKFGQLYGLRNSGELQRSQQPNFYMLAANHYYTPSVESSSGAVQLDGVQNNSTSNNVIVAANGEQFDVLPAYGDCRRAQYTGHTLSVSTAETPSDDLFFESKSSTSSSAPDIVQSTIKFAAAAGEVDGGGVGPVMSSRFYEQ